MVSTIDEARTPAELAEWLRVWADGYEEGVDYLDDNDARQLAEAVERVCTNGNASALHDALERIVRYEDGIVGCIESGHASGVDWDGITFAMIQTAKEAIAAPARNCDRFATAEEAVAAFADHLRAWENAHGICSEYPDHAVQVPAGAFAWLFDKAEGGVK